MSPGPAPTLPTSGPTSLDDEAQATIDLSGTSLDRSLGDLIAAIDRARTEVSSAPAGTASRTDELGEQLATIHLEVSVLAAARRIDDAGTVSAVALATESVAVAAGTWLDDPIIQRRLAAMQLRDRAGTVTRRVDAAVDELIHLASALRGGPGSCDVEQARARARRAVRSTRACLTDAVLSVRHAG